MMAIEDIIAMAEMMASVHQGEFQGGEPLKAFKDFSIQYAERDFPDPFDGLLRYKNGSFQVFVNKAHAQTLGRRRFTAAHELGHFSIAHHKNGILQGDMLHASNTGFVSKLDYEYEADIFAAHFLMPTPYIKKKIRSRDWGAEEIFDVSRKFGTSLTSAALRCQQVLSGDSTLLYWKDGVCRWYQSGGIDWNNAPFWPIRDSGQLATGSATEMVMKGENGTKPFLMRGTTKSFWTNKVRHWNDYNNEVLIEYAIPLGQYGVLTLLRPDR